VWYFSIGNRTITQSKQKIPHCQNSYTIQSKNTTQTEQLHNPIKKYHTVRTVTQSNRKIPHWQNSYTIQSKNTTLSEQLHNSIKKYHTDRTVTQSTRKIPHWQNSYTIQSKNTTLSECGIIRLDCVTVMTVWYISIGLCNCSDSVVFFDWIV
jgi:hypothetical protein